MREDADRDRELWIAVELSARGTALPPGPLTDAVAESILTALLRLNSEFANYVPAARQRPRITLWPTGHPDYFRIGVKHRYSRPRRRGDRRATSPGCTRAVVLPARRRGAVSRKQLGL